MTYAIEILRRAQRELQLLPHEDYERVREAIRALAQNPIPPSCLALTGRTGWRIGVGNYCYNAERQGLGREFREEVQRVLDFLGASSMCAMAHTKYTPEALLSMPDGDQYELVDGELVERQMGFRSSRIGGELFGLLRAHCRQHQLGWVLPSDAGYQCFPDDPSKVRKPDVSFIQAARLAAEDEPEGWATIAPDLAVEVVSPNDLFEAVSVKVREYLAAGVRLVWVIDTATQMVYVYPHDRRGEILTQADDLSGEDVVEGFHCRVADLFAPPVG